VLDPQETFGGVMPGSLGFEARELHHLAPLLGFLNEELAEVCRRAQKRRTADFSKFQSQAWIDEGGIYLRVDR